MNFTRLYLFVIGVFVTLALGWAGIVGVPRLMLRRAETGDAGRRYTAEELHGRSIYIREGCMYCHSQQTRSKGFGADQERLWGRASVPSDYAYDRPHLLGTMRTGPDLFNIAVRQPSRDWHLLHLHDPRSVTPGSIMPPYPWLFETRLHPAPGEQALPLPDSVTRGMAVVPTEEGKDLVTYLLSLDHTKAVATHAHDSTQSSR